MSKDFIFIQKHARLPRWAGMVLNNFGKWCETAPLMSKEHSSDSGPNCWSFWRIGEKKKKKPTFPRMQWKQRIEKCHMSSPSGGTSLSENNVLHSGVKYLSLFTSSEAKPAGFHPSWRRPLTQPMRRLDRGWEMFHPRPLWMATPEPMSKEKKKKCWILHTWLFYYNLKFIFYDWDVYFGTVERCWNF